jgi:selenocysteine-specific translation elongation factor
MMNKRKPSRTQTTNANLAELLTNSNGRVSFKDAQRLRPHLTSYTKLAELLMIDPPNGPSEKDLEHLLVLELGGQKRKNVIKKIVGRMLSLRRKKIYEAIGLEA